MHTDCHQMAFDLVAGRTPYDIHDALVPARPVAKVVKRIHEADDTMCPNCANQERWSAQRAGRSKLHQNNARKYSPHSVTFFEQDNICERYDLLNVRFYRALYLEK